jgi:hypothetical protein
MTLSRTLQLPTGMAIIFACRPARAADPMAPDPTRQDFDSLSAEPDASAETPSPFTPRDP